MPSKQLIIVNCADKTKVIGIPRKSDGTIDKRCSKLQVLKKDGSRDKRTAVKIVKK